MNRSERFSDTDLCVKCGLCLPHCPTYGKTLDENESPRGRIALIQGWAQGSLEATPELIRHIDNCLLCRSCEAVCPAYVPYGSLVDRFRGETGAAGKTAFTRVKAAGIRIALTNKRASRWMERLVGNAGKSSRGLLRKTGLLKALGLSEFEAGLPDTSTSARRNDFYPAQGQAERSRAALFLGCTANLLDAETVAAALLVLNRLGVGVHVPSAQACCGALHYHAGDRISAYKLMESNLAAFGLSDTDTVVTIASGCGAMLRDYPQLEPAAADFSKSVKDISQFLTELSRPDDIEFKPLAAKVCVHVPCTLKNVLRAERCGADLLRRIPSLEVAPLPSAQRCCGAAGSYMLEHPETARDLRDDVLKQVAAINPDFLATSNPGCALHLRAGLKQKGLGHIEVLHPVALLARQLVQ
ncbi:(Fe-S)-binding protein [Methylocaldum sp. MU1018]